MEAYPVIESILADTDNYIDKKFESLTGRQWQCAFFDVVRIFDAMFFQYVNECFLPEYNEKNDMRVMAFLYAFPKLIQSVVEYILEPREFLNEDEDNYVKLIQEWSLKEYGELPQICVENANYMYDHSGLIRTNEIRFIDCPTGMCVINVEEYNKTHFRCELSLKGIDKVFISEGRSKNKAYKCS